MLTTRLANYAWIITNDAQILLPGEKSVKGKYGPSNCPLKPEAILSDPRAKRFRILDDDGELYYEGLFVPLTDDADEFAPLDDFGTPSLGATEIRYFEGGKWCRL